MRKATDEVARVSQVFFARDRAFGVNLRAEPLQTNSAEKGGRERDAYGLAVENMLSTHDGVHGRRFLEGQECESSRSSVLIPQNGTVLYFTKL